MLIFILFVLLFFSKYFFIQQVHSVCSDKLIFGFVTNWVKILVVLGKNRSFREDCSIEQTGSISVPWWKNIKNRKLVVNKHIYIVLNTVFLSSLLHSEASYLQLGSQTLKICWEWFACFLLEASLTWETSLLSLTFILCYMVLSILILSVDMWEKWLASIQKLAASHCQYISVMWANSFPCIPLQRCSVCMQKYDWVLSICSTGLLWQEPRFFF